MTVGSRISLDRPPLSGQLAGFAAKQPLTAGGEFHPALNRYKGHYRHCIYNVCNILAQKRHKTPKAPASYNYRGKRALVTKYTDMGLEDIRELHSKLEQEYTKYCSLGLKLNMARGKPSPEQLDLSLPMLDCVNSTSTLLADDGCDCRNYGVLAGLPEARELMGSLVGAAPEQVVVCGASSLNIMFDTISRAWSFGLGGEKPWSQQKEVKFLCPSPGYDRHFAICEHFGIEMIPIELDEDGPDVFQIKKLVKDESVKGIWCVPQYSNPSGCSYSDAVVKALAALKPAAPDFRIFWDNAYVVHHLFDEAENQDHVLNMLEECAAAGNPDMVFEFCSTSKVTFPGSGIAAFISSEGNVAEMLEAMKPQTIGFDKINQLRHVRFLKDADGVAEHMRKHAALLRPRFQTVLDIFEEDFAGTGIGTWTTPRGGYFISFTGLEGTAKATVFKARMAGVTLTDAGATWPYHDDPHDADIRIAPSFPSIEELEQAARIFTICARMAALEKIMLHA